MGIMQKSIVMIVILIMLGLVIWTIQLDFPLPEGHLFCKDKGYDGTSIGGSYSEKFGKVKCVSCYDGECEYGEFEVYKKFGIIKEK